jgi:MYXO-CTERM domain-containing protein
MSLIRPASSSAGSQPCRQLFALVALTLSCAFATAQTTTPAVSSVVAFSLSSPVDNLLRGSDGALYGVVLPVTGVTSGLIFRAAVDGTATTTLYQFDREEANGPQAGLVQASDGKLYGTTKFGRAGELSSAGTVYRLGLDGTGFEVVHRFAPTNGANQDLSPINTDGAFPETQLIEGSDGYLYGVTRNGGPNGTGVVYKLMRDGTDFQVLHQFAAITSATGSGLTVTTDGAYPVGRLVQGADGLFYGTASLGGANGRGTVFRLAFDGSGFQVIHTFSPTILETATGLSKNEEGAIPIAGLTDGQDGFFYGVTTVGGSGGVGTVFATSPDGATFKVLQNFALNNGSRPEAELLLGSDGKLYGTTVAGGESAAGAATSFGTIFSINRYSGDGADVGYQRLYSFDTQHGSGPMSNLVELSPTVFVGLAGGTGRCGYGTLYRYSATGDTVAGNADCGGNNNNRNNDNGGGATGALLLLLFGGLGWWRRRHLH